jgi:transcriptional regulator with XRE-family HTH domain
MEFKDWFYQKYTEWRGRSHRSLAEFAQHLGLSQAIASNWVNGQRSHPESYHVITALAYKYPEIYSVLDLPAPYGDDVQQLAEAWLTLTSDDHLKILRIANAGKLRQENNLDPIAFGDWIFKKFYEWRGQSRLNRHISQFARHIGVSQVTASHWINGTRANITDYRAIVALSRTYPEIYRDLGLPLPYCSEIQQVAETWLELQGENQAQICAFLSNLSHLVDIVHNGNQLTNDLNR